MTEEGAGSGNHTVSVVVPVHRGGPAFQRCLSALARFDPPPLESWVVCDGDLPEDRARASTVGVHLLGLAERAGPAAARNAGAAAASGGIVLFLDADVEAPSRLVGQIGERFAADPELDAVIGSYDAAPADPGVVSRFRNLLHHHVHQTANPRATTFWGACGAIRRATFERVGGFDESFRVPSIEDIELGYRLSEAGCRMALDREIQVKHLKRWSLLDMLRTDVFQRAVPWGRLLLHRRSLPNDLNLTRARRASVVASLTILACLALALLSPAAAGLVATIALAVLIGLDLPFYGLMRRRRGLRAALVAVPLHWLHYASSGIAFAACLAEHVAHRSAALVAAARRHR